MNPIKFTPVYKQILWGGTGIMRHFGRSVPFDKVAESWEICCREDGMSVVSEDMYKGRTLKNLIEEFGKELLGTDVYQKYGSDFPLLIKIIDANDRLSVQVHPDDGYAKSVGEKNGKNEMWYIIDAKPGAKLVYGLADGITKEQFEKAVRENRIGSTLREVGVKPGDAFYIPAGTVHAILDGILIAEIQQNSNTTYRLFDWDRVGADGKGRELHISKALDVINFGVSREPAAGAVIDSGEGFRKKSILRSAFFNIDELTLDGTYESQTSNSTFIVLMSIEGEGCLTSSGSKTVLNPGDTVLLPANTGKYSLSGKQKILCSFL